MFVAAAQWRYVFQYCLHLQTALADEQDGEHVIDIDAVADTAGKERDRPVRHERVRSGVGRTPANSLPARAIDRDGR
jgi:hypothetical protein